MCRSEGDREGSCVPLSESVPAFAIKSGRGRGVARAKTLFTGGVMFGEGGFRTITRSSVFAASVVPVASRQSSPLACTVIVFPNAL